ncbi:MAG TPA: FAD-dependent thymidylate synthase [Polyangiaceae bacterium]|nr:FAD-dependent thymidylate synthase [Polyangiaceae bacterium]
MDVTKRATIVTDNPVVAPIGEMQLNAEGILKMMDWVGAHRPECLPAEFDPGVPSWMQLYPHDLKQDGRRLSSNELLVELAGRKCYDSFGLRAGKKSNAEYIANTQAGEVPHASILYHAKMSFFIAGVSRRVSHELIRNYVGADRDEEGNPSQESTRFTHHYGWYIAHPYLLNLPGIDRRSELARFAVAMQDNYNAYLDFVQRRFEEFEKTHGAPPKGLDRKRVYESASAYLSHACETSFIWTTNPMALAKLFRERDNESADLEFQRLARVWKGVCLQHWPNLFPQPWMQPQGQGEIGRQS